MDRELLRLLPRVLRARDFHLYLEGGKRLTDLWLNGGKALLGHKPAGVLREIKSTAQRGLFSPLPSPLEGRILKALGEIFPGRAFRLYPDDSSLYRALEEASAKEAALKEAASPLLKGIVPWRPFLDSAEGKGGEDPHRAPILIPLLPWPLGPSVLVMDKAMEAFFPPGELIPPLILAPAIRSLYELIGAMKEKTPRYMKIERALKNSIWQRKGIYLFLRDSGEGPGGKEDYSALWKRFLEGAFLLPPSAAEATTLPMIMSAGEEANLAKLIGGEKP